MLIIQSQRTGSLHMASFPNKCSWGCDIADVVCIASDLQNDLYKELNHVSVSLMQSRHLISNRE